MLNWLWLAWSFAALAVGADSLPPSTPQDLKAVALSSGAILLTWRPATDDVAVVSYLVERDGRLIADVADHHFKDAAVTLVKNYHYRVSAVDGDGNRSHWSHAVAVDQERKP